MKYKLRLKVNAPLPGLKINNIVTVECDKFQTPIEKYWRDRIKDSYTDNCVTIVENENENEIEHSREEMNNDNC